VKLWQPSILTGSVSVSSFDKSPLKLSVKPATRPDWISLDMIGGLQIRLPGANQIKIGGLLASAD